MSRRNKNTNGSSARTGNDALYVYKDLFTPSPSDVKSQWNIATCWYRTRLYRRLVSIVNIEGYPELWKRIMPQVKAWLFLDGRFCVYNDNRYGIIPVRCDTYGQNFAYMPTNAIFANPVLGNRDMIIGRECEVVYLNWNSAGCITMLNNYAQRLANIDASVDVNLMNTRNAVIFDCDGEAQEKSARKLYDDLTEGKPAIFRRTQNSKLTGDGGIKVTTLNAKNNYITDLLQQSKRRIWDEFLTEIGINNNPEAGKKERSITDEVNVNYDELKNSIDDWKENIDSTLELTNNLFGTTLRAVYPYYKNLEINEKDDVNPGKGNDEESQST